MSVGIKTCPCPICYECVQFQIEIQKISRCGSRSPNNAEFGHFTSLFCRGRQRNVPRIITHVHSYCCSLNLLFGDVLVAVAVVFCVRSLMAHEGQHQSPLELITHNVRSILADVLNKLECGDVDHSTDFREWQGISGPLVGEAVGFLQVFKMFPWNVKFVLLCRF